MNSTLLLLLAVRSLLAITLLASAGAKIADLDQFVETIRAFSPPKRTERAVAVSVIVIEAGVGLIALGGAWPNASDAILFLLTLVLLAVSLFAAVRRPGIECNCFGAFTRARFGAVTSLRSFILASLAAATLVVGRSIPTTTPGYWAIPIGVVGALFVLASEEAAKGIRMSRENRG